MAAIEAATAREAQDAPDSLDARAAGPHRPAGDHGGPRGVPPPPGPGGAPLAVGLRWGPLLPALRRAGGQSASRARRAARRVARLLRPEEAREAWGVVSPA